VIFKHLVLLKTWVRNLTAVATERERERKENREEEILAATFLGSITN
jgi:CRISPR/Cas system CSM-associated protein Csm2 small subunit